MGGKDRQYGSVPRDGGGRGVNGRSRQKQNWRNIFKKYNSKNISQLLKFEDLKSTTNSRVVRRGGQSGDKVAQEILKQAGKEIALAVRVAAKLICRTGALVLAGGVGRAGWPMPRWLNRKRIIRESLILFCGRSGGKQ